VLVLYRQKLTVFTYSTAFIFFKVQLPLLFNKEGWANILPCLIYYTGKCCAGPYKSVQQYMYKGNNTCTKATIHVQRQQYMYKGNTTCTMATLHVQRQQYMYKGNNTCTKATLHVQRQQYMYKGNNTCTKATIHVQRQQYMYKGENEPNIELCI